MVAQGALCNAVYPRFDWHHGGIISRQTPRHEPRECIHDAAGEKCLWRIVL